MDSSSKLYSVLGIKTGQLSHILAMSNSPIGPNGLDLIDSGMILQLLHNCHSEALVVKVERTSDKLQRLRVYMKHASLLFIQIT